MRKVPAASTPGARHPVASSQPFPSAAASADSSSSTCTINIYTDRAHYRPEHRRQLVHLLRPMWDGHPTVGPPELRMVPRPELADVAVLPMTWNYYVDQRQHQQAFALGATANAAGKLLLVFAAGDREPVVPIDNAVVFHPGPSRTQCRRARALALPSFIPDVRKLYFGDKPIYREKQPLPVVGFCGHGASPAYKLALAVLRNAIDTMRYLAGQLTVVPTPITPSVVLRARILRTLHDSPLIDDRFLVRRDYRAGVRDLTAKADPLHPTRLEFVRAIHDCDYTLCVRGGGNFSLRLYETLALGRIPIFVDTDSMLPFDFLLDWRQHCCWIDEGDRERVAEKVAAFHASMSPTEFIERQRGCRRLWEEWLSTDGYRRHFVDYLRYCGVVSSGADDGAARLVGPDPVDADDQPASVDPGSTIA